MTTEETVRGVLIRSRHGVISEMHHMRLFAQTLYDMDGDAHKLIKEVFYNSKLSAVEFEFVSETPQYASESMRCILEAALQRLPQFWWDDRMEHGG